jgi:hypothetical protein
VLWQQLLRGLASPWFKVALLLSIAVAGWFWTEYVHRINDRRRRREAEFFTAKPRHTGSKARNAHIR